MIKPRILVLFMLLTGMEGLGLLLILANTPSAAENTVLWGLSVPRLVLAAILLFGSLVAFGLGLAAWLITPLGRRTAGWLDCAASRPEQLLAVSFFLLVGVFAAPGMVGVSLTLGWTRIFERVAPLLAWISLACGQALGILALSYSSAFQLPGFFHNAPVKIIRGSFLGRIETWAVLSVLIVAGCVLGVSSPASSGLVVSHDSGIFLYFGQEILNGQIPFRDLWDHKPPLIFYLDALGLFLGRGSLWGVWFLEFLALVSSALMAFSTLRRFYRSLPAILAATGMLASSIFLLEGGNLTEEFALPLQWGALFLFARWRGSNRDRGWDPIALATGVLFGLAFSLKQTMIGVWVSLYLYLGLRFLFTRERHLSRFLTWSAVGILAVQLVWIIYFAVHGTLGEYFRVAYIYNLLYSDASNERRMRMLTDLATFLTGTSGYFTFALLAWISALLAAGHVIVRQGRAVFTRAISGSAPGFLLAVALLDVLIELVLISTSGKNYRHYFLSLLPGFSVLTAWGLFRLQMLTRRALVSLSAGIRRVLSITGGSALLVLLFFASSVELGNLARSTPAATIPETARYIHTNTQPGDYVLVWGSQTTLNFLSQRRAPTRFVHQKPLFRAGFASLALSNELLRDLQAKTPELIVNTFLPSTPFITFGADGKCYLPANPIPAGMEDVYDFICEHYRLETILTRDKWEIYRLQVGSGQSYHLKK